MNRPTQHYQNQELPHDKDRGYIIRVGSYTDASSLAGAVAKRVRLTGVAHLRAIGAAATNQAVKGITIASDYLVADNISIVYTSAFEDLVVRGEARTAINFTVTAS